MKKLFIKAIKLYQKIPFKTHQHCKFIPTCSNYAIIVIDEFGAFKGSILTIKRLLKCNPWNKGGIDLPQIKNKRKES